MMIVAFLAGVLAQDELPFFRKFEFARERVGHKVVADIVLVNPLRADLVDVRVMILFFDGDREVKRSKPAMLVKVARESTAALKIETEQVEKFSRYDVLLEMGGKQRLYSAKDPGKLPEATRGEPAKLALASATAVPPDAFPGEVVATVVAKNTGDLDAQEPTVTVTFTDGAGAAVHQARVRLEAEVRGQSEETFEVRIPKVPAYEKLRMGVAHLVAEGPAWPDGPEGAKAVDLRQSRVVKLSDGSLRVSGVVRNGLAGPVSRVTATFKFGGKNHPVVLGGALKPGETREIEAYLAGVDSFDGGSFGLSYEDGGEGAAPAAPKASSKRTATKALEAGPLVKPPPEKASEKPLVDNAQPKLSVGMRPLGWIEGFTLKDGKYSGDVAVLRLVCVDADGKPAQPTGTMTVTLYQGDKPFQKVQRIVTKESWKLDSAKVNNQNVKHDLLAYDAKANDLWVALHRSDGRSSVDKVDVQLVARDAGTWEWKGIHAKSAEMAPRGADKK